MTATPSPIVGQAVIVVTEAPAGRFQIRSFESPEGPSTAAGRWADRIVRLVHDAVTGAVVDAAVEPDLARLRRIETAAGEVLASGQARYTHLADDGEYVGDLIPAAKMIALAEAVHGAQVVDEKPPAASDEYARGLEAALFEGAGDVGVSTPRDALSFARETVTAARAAANRGDPIHPTMTLKLVRLSEIGMGLAEAIRSGHCGPEAGSIRCLRAVVDACAEHADDQDDDGCPVGDPDCDAPDDGEWHSHEWCEAPGNEEALVEGAGEVRGG